MMKFSKPRVPGHLRRRHLTPSGASKGMTEMLSSMRQSEWVTRDVWFSGWIHSFTLLKRRAFKMTDTELKLIAAPASMGLSSKTKKGYSTPAATGMPSTL